MGFKVKPTVYLGVLIHLFQPWLATAWHAEVAVERVADPRLLKRTRQCVRVAAVMQHRMAGSHFSTGGPSSAVCVSVGHRPYHAAPYAVRGESMMHSPVFRLYHACTQRRRLVFGGHKPVKPRLTCASIQRTRTRSHAACGAHHAIALHVCITYRLLPSAGRYDPTN